FLILAFIGLMLLVREGGGLLASREYYFSHARDVELPKIEEYGTLLWRIFYPFGAWFLLASCLTEPRQDVRRIEGVLFFATVVVGFGIILWLRGSRTEMLYGLGGALCIYNYLRRRIKLWWMVTTTSLIVCISTAVVFFRITLQDNLPAEEFSRYYVVESSEF